MRRSFRTALFIQPNNQLTPSIIPPNSFQISFVFFTFPRSLKKDKKRKRLAELQNSIDQCITITTEQCPKNQLTQLNNQLSQLSNQAGLCDSCSTKNQVNLKCTNVECANNSEKPAIIGLPPNPSQLVSFLNSSANANAGANNLAPFANPANLAQSTTTTKLQLSIAPATKRHHRHHSASAMINCTSSFLLGDQGYTAPQPIRCNATTNIKLGHHRSISTSTIHHHLHHLYSNLNAGNAANAANNPLIGHPTQQQSQDRQPLVAKENELKLDLYKRDGQKPENNGDFESSMDSCSLISSSVASERKLKDIPSCMWSLLTNPVYILTCLGSCMELCIVSGFLVFLPKYLETQFSISKSQANLYSGGIAVPGACVGIFLGGYLLKKLQLKPKGKTIFVGACFCFDLRQTISNDSFGLIGLNAFRFVRRHPIRALLQSRLYGTLHGTVSIFPGVFSFQMFFIFVDLCFL